MKHRDFRFFASLFFPPVLLLLTGCEDPIALDTDSIRQQLIRIPFLVDRSTLEKADRRIFQRDLREYLTFLEHQNNYKKLWQERRTFRGSQSLGVNWATRWANLKEKPETFSDLLFDTGRRIQIGVAIAAMETQLWVFCIHEGDEGSCKDVETTADFTRDSFARLEIPKRLDALMQGPDIHPSTLNGLEDLRRQTLVTLAQAPSFPVRLGTFETRERKGDRDTDYIAYLRHLQHLYDGIGEDAKGDPAVTTVTLGFRDLDIEHLVPVETLLERTNQVRAIRNSLWWSAKHIESRPLEAISLTLARNILLSHHCQLRRATAARILADPLWSKTLVTPDDGSPYVDERDRQIFARDLVRGKKNLTQLGERARSLSQKRPQLLAEIQRLSRLFGEIEFSTKFIDRALAKIGWSEFEVGIRARQSLSNLLESDIAELLSPLSDDCKKN